MEEGRDATEVPEKFMPLGPQFEYQTMQAAKASMKEVEDKLWKVNRGSPGNSVSRLGLVCNAHVGCTRRIDMKAILYRDTR